MSPHCNNPAPAQRLFLALWPGDGVRQQLAAHADLWDWPAGCVRYQPEDWHLTLHFIGAVQTDQIAALADCAAVALTPFTLVLDQPACWPQGLAVLAASTVPSPLLALHERLSHVMRERAMSVDARPYRPHVTLARRAMNAQTPAVVTPVTWPVRHYALVQSTGGHAPRYQTIRQYG